MKSIRCAEQLIRSAISRSKVPEDPLHAENTLAWVLKLMPEADEALKLAALGHDIDRAIENRRVQKNRFPSFDEFKAAHASNSAEILRSILQECGVDEHVSFEVCRLVRLHETGGDERSDILKNADAVSYFQYNLPLYFARNGLLETKRRTMWGYARLSPELRQIVGQLRFESEDINALLQEVALEGVEDPRGRVPMAKQEHASFFDSIGHWKTDVLRLHSRARALLKNARKRLSRGQSVRFFQALIKQGDLVFDIGANVGDMTAEYLELGARVVAAEPQEACLRILEKRFGRNPGVSIIPMAVAASEGEQELMLSDIRSPISSMSRQWIAAVKSSGRFPYYEWSRSVTVQVTTLDSLIAQYGEPDFCKIDVEGFDQEVLKGLSIPLARLSFEFHAEFLAEAFSCLERLRELGTYRFNFTQENRTVFESTQSLNLDEMYASLRSLPYSSLQGDVYAFRER